MHREGDTPHLDALLSSAHRFHRAYAPASKTVTSLPPTLHSCEPHEDPDAVGQPLGVRMSELGLTGAAVVPQYFLMPVEGARESLLAGFRHSAFVRKDRQSDLPALVDETFSRLGDAPFLGWIHFYSLHAPYYTDRLTSSADGSARERYRAALQHFDGDLHRVMVGLEQRGQLDNTIVVLLSDHGENLGDNRRSGHGSTVLEEVVRVPLAIRVPGSDGGDVEQTVGTIDLVPTLLDLLGAPADPSLRGVSLVPLMLDPGAPWSRSYMLSSGRRTVQGVVAGREKLFLELGPGLFYRFDLATDPAETRNLYADGPADRRPWLRLSERWPKPYRAWASLLTAMMRREPPAEVLVPLLRNVTTLVDLPPDIAPSALLVGPLLEHARADRPEVARAAIDGLASLGAKASLPVLRELAADPTRPPRVRQALLHALLRLEGHHALSTVLALGEEPLLVVDAIEALAQLGDRAALPFLERIVDEHYNRFTRRRARAAITAIEEASGAQ